MTDKRGGERVNNENGEPEALKKGRRNRLPFLLC